MIASEEPACCFPAIIEIREVGFDNARLWDNEGDFDLPWSEITEVCEGNWIHGMAIVEFDFIGIRTDDDTFTVWICEPDTEFRNEILRRFPQDKVEPPWLKRRNCVSSVVVWPKTKFGKPMYFSRKNHWWERPRVAWGSTAPDSSPTPRF